MQTALGRGSGEDDNQHQRRTKQPHFRELYHHETQAKSRIADTVHGERFGSRAKSFADGDGCEQQQGYDSDESHGGIGTPAYRAPEREVGGEVLEDFAKGSRIGAPVDLPPGEHERATGERAQAKLRCREMAA